MFKKLILILLTILPLAAHAELPVVQDAFIAPTPPGAKVAAAFMTFRNNGPEAIELLAAKSSAIERVEIHLSKIENDVAKMEKQDSVQVPAGGTVTFKHGGYHFMLMGLTEQLKDGDVIPLMITTSAGDLHIDVPVGISGEMLKHGHKKNEHGEHGGEHGTTGASEQETNTTIDPK